MIYISGAITGNENYIDDFLEAEKFLLKNGFSVFNPATYILNHKDFPILKNNWDLCMKEDLKFLLECDSIYLLKGWQNSRGCLLEKHIAMQLNYKMYYQTGDFNAKL